MVNNALNSLKMLGIDCDLPTKPHELLEKFTKWGIDYTLFDHEPVFTVEESRDVDAKILGQHTRNLFLRDKKGKMFLVTLRVDTPVDLRKLEGVIGAGRLSFGSPERLWQYLGVRPGSVTPFAIINDHEKLVTPIWDADMMDADIVNCHPLLNTMTVSMSPAGWQEFAKAISRDDVRILNLDDARP